MGYNCRLWRLILMLSVCVCGFKVYDTSIHIVLKRCKKLANNEIWNWFSTKALEIIGTYFSTIEPDLKKSRSCETKLSGKYNLLHGRQLSSSREFYGMSCPQLRTILLQMFRRSLHSIAQHQLTSIILNHCDHVYKQ